LSDTTTQADKAILAALERADVRFKIEKDNVQVHKLNRPGKAFHFDATDCPDLFPPLVALASVCGGTSVIRGVHRLEHKESNRALTLQQEFGKMGVEIVLKDDEMLIKGGGKILAANVSSHHDHRIAMACAVASLAANGKTIIEGAEAVNKSYPQFWTHLQQLNVLVTLNDN
jgi:3-phosphoshikimate 1-carboxyvinyltransferase